MDLPTDPITRSVLKGFLEAVGGNEVNFVNVMVMAHTLGLLVEEVRSNEETDFNEWLHVTAYSDGHKISAGGTFFSARHHPRIVRLNSRPVEIVPKGVLLILSNKDRPGIVGYLGSLMAKHQVNIANMSLSRDAMGGQALTVLNLDSVPPSGLLEELQKDSDISNVRVVKL